MDHLVGFGRNGRLLFPYLVLLLAACGSDSDSGSGASDDGAATAEMDATEGSAGMDGAASDTDSGASGEDLGMGDGSDVITIGDSWMNLGSVGIQQSLLAVSGQPYRTYGVPGTRLLNGEIPSQYEMAKADNPDIKTVVVSAGGNDILMNVGALLDCVSVGPTCMEVIHEVGARYLSFREEMAADGVEDVVVVAYTRGTLLGAAPIDYVYESIAQDCSPDDPLVRCHLVDPDEVAGGTMELRDGIHPTDENYDLLGQHIHDLMIAEGIRR